MKFKDEYSKKLFKMEISDTSELIDNKQINQFVEYRKLLGRSLNRESYKLGCNLLSESLANKSTRIKSSINKLLNNEYETHYDRLNILKSLSSLNTHIIIEMEYYHSLYENIELTNLYNAYTKLYNKLSTALLSEGEVKLTKKEIQLLKSIF